MPTIPFTDPTAPVHLPFWTRLRAQAQIAAERALPPRWLLMLSMQAARVTLALSPKRRRRLEELLRPLSPPGTPLRELRRQAALSRAVKQQSIRSFAPVLQRSREWLLRVFRPEGLEHLEAARKGGKGAILLQSHIGHAAWQSPVLRGLGYPAKLVQRRVTGPRTYLLLKRAGLLGEVLPFPAAGQEGLHLKRLLDLLRRGVWIQHIGDALDKEGGLPGVFLGEPVRYGRAPWTLARLSHAPLIPALILMDARCRPRLFIGEPLRVGAGGDALEAAFHGYLAFLNRHVAGVPWNLHMYHREFLLGRTPGPAEP